MGPGDAAAELLTALAHYGAVVTEGGAVVYESTHWNDVCGAGGAHTAQTVTRQSQSHTQREHDIPISEEETPPPNGFGLAADMITPATRSRAAGSSGARC